MTGELRALRWAAVIEAGSLVVLLVNRFTVHAEAVTSLTGPLHGAAYLIVIALAFLLPDAPRAARWSAAVPGIGGLLVLRLARTARPT